MKHDQLLWGSITQISAIRILIQVLKNVRFCISLQMFLELWLNFFLGTAFGKKHFAKTPMLKLFFHHSNCRTYFLQKIVCQLLWSQSCAGCQSCYIGETKHHLPARIKEHLQTDTKFHILQHLNENLNCRDLRGGSPYIITDHASSSCRLKLKEAFHITWLKPVLNKQKNHVSQFQYNVRYFRLQHFRLFTSFVSLLLCFFAIQFIIQTQFYSIDIKCNHFK